MYTTLLPCLALLLLYSPVASAEEIIINERIDEMLVNLRSAIMYSNIDSLPVPDVENSFEKKVSRWYRARGKFKATGGSVKSAASALRTGDATLTSTPTNTVTLHLGFGLVEVYYERYTASFLGVRVSGDVRLTVGEFSHLVVFTLAGDKGNCEAVLAHSAVEYLDGIEVEVSGLGALDWAFEKISEWLIRSFKEDIQRRLEEVITRGLHRTLSNRLVCYSLSSLI